MLCRQKVAHGGGTMNLRNLLRTKHHSMYDELFASNSVTQSSLETFVRSTEVKKVPPHSICAVLLLHAGSQH